MRTPNTECIICQKPLYRRPFELKKVRYVACMEHREEAKRIFPLTEKQRESLSLGRVKGDNHLSGIPKSEESKIRRSKAMRDWCKNNPDSVVRRGEKCRGENHYNWKGGSSSLNLSIRLMSENRKWMDVVKDRDKCCVICGSVNNLESHHIVSLTEIVNKNNITTRDQARQCSEMWDISNGITYCSECHAEKHNRVYTKPQQGRKYKPKSPAKRRVGAANPNWKGGKVKKYCVYCDSEYWVKPCEVVKSKYCSRRCVSASQRKAI